MYAMVKKTWLRVDHLQDLRRRDNLSQEDLALTLGISQQHVSKWEAGNNDPSAEMLIRLAQTFSVSVDFLLGLAEHSNGVSEARKSPDLKDLLDEFVTPENAPEILEYVARSLKR